ncbi:alpha/beta fold hydrolase BchO [Sphingomonas baiyangensis]|uniref:Alpha/beta fold hydrolase n=1 Tax=Sphingomonas baiyangensis TaxID=2572576 RepID=A0A4V5PTQ7_9SPHN|nr:alpha/beta fold hydrolase BchO [Sphingomonas baiyangensis]TKD50958.1 alpha/beta fold hydrolase [Sphingomonas baiyangensis]
MTLDFARQGADWPNRAASRFVDAGRLRFHVQAMGSGPVALLLHGTGAATHSWRGAAPLLAEHFRVIAPDLPGHGFTRGRPAGGMSLPAMRDALVALLDTLEVTPDVIVGHSAGAALAMALAERHAPEAIVGLNPALTPFPGLAARIFPTLAKLLFANPFAPHIFAQIARAPGEVERFLLRSTGSRIDREGLRHYAALVGDAGHCGGAIAMMAGWDLEAVRALLPRVATPVLLLHGAADSAIPLDAVEAAAARLPDARVESLAGLGHLAHEEAPALVAARVVAFATAAMRTREAA